MPRENNQIAIVATVGLMADKKQTIHAWMGPNGMKRFMAFPHVLLAECDGVSVMLYRYCGDGEFCGDTWHASLEDAQHQAEYEYGKALGPWLRVPTDVADAHRYAVALAQKTRQV